MSLPQASYMTLGKFIKFSVPLSPFCKIIVGLTLQSCAKHIHQVFATFIIIISRKSMHSTLHQQSTTSTKFHWCLMAHLLPLCSEFWTSTPREENIFGCGGKRTAPIWKTCSGDWSGSLDICFLGLLSTSSQNTDNFLASGKTVSAR